MKMQCNNKLRQRSYGSVGRTLICISIHARRPGRQEAVHHTTTRPDARTTAVKYANDVFLIIWSSLAVVRVRSRSTGRRSSYFWPLFTMLRLGPVSSHSFQILGSRPAASLPAADGWSRCSCHSFPQFRCPIIIASDADDELCQSTFFLFLGELWAEDADRPSSLLIFPTPHIGPDGLHDPTRRRTSPGDPLQV
jgi:hypothetical protein